MPSRAAPTITRSSGSAAAAGPATPRTVSGRAASPGDVPVKANRFIWAYQGRTAARIVGTDTVDAVETRIVTFHVQQGRTSIWYRLWVDHGDRVRRAEMKAPGHFMDHRYADFGEPITIEPPD